ncbi:glycine--tRNA ligase subunit beta [Listeria grayi]|uniref:glycine--tRNA ligase subunit beta n=1 Tax=Listeria grayi TaxID=1641 RepID=UPI00162AF3F9|nr:glycine--tRNA ligase subunit beta [Listeria grayi]MBC1920642.1 glycine--tRNA ligase subunit beta [Listeria grayi]
MSKDFLLEIGLEEMPAKYVTPSVRQLKERVADWLLENKISYENIETYATPRRLALIVKAMADKQEDRIEEAKGPAKKIALDENGDWSKAALGFARSQQVDPSELGFQSFKDVDYLFVKKEVPGQPTISLLPEIKACITAMNFPVSMHWGSNEMRFIRPIKWLIALFDKDVIPFEIAGVSTGKVTRGHRFLGQEAEINEPSEYTARLLEQFVVANSEERKAAIREQLHEIELVENWKIEIDETLLEEVNNLVEYPTVLTGDFEEKYLTLPEEILITTMKEHQRYFPAFSQDGTLLPHFITVRNGNEEHLEIVAKGNEKVLRARLSDAEFFYLDDLKQSIDDCVAKLRNIVFHEKLGTLTEKMKRVEKVASLLADQLGLSAEKKDKLIHLAAIYKFDLVTHIVDEFPELQGLMGEKYALLQGEEADVAAAIREHYLPTSAEGELPQTELGSILAIADKLETLIAFFAVGIVPTGSQDPFSLRRNALGIMRIMKANKWNIRLLPLIREVIKIEQAELDQSLSVEELQQEIIQFLKQRLKAIMLGEAIRYDIIDAVLDSTQDNVPELLERASVLNNYSADSGNFRETIESLSRVVNLAKKHEKEVVIDPALFENQEEKTLFEALESLKQNFQSLPVAARLESLIALKPAIEAYFDKILVMSGDNAVRNNRLELLFELSNFIKEFAQTDVINVK